MFRGKLFIGKLFRGKFLNAEANYLEANCLEANHRGKSLFRGKFEMDNGHRSFLFAPRILGAGHRSFLFSEQDVACFSSRSREQQGASLVSLLGAPLTG
jgi:hypothetical protein